MTFQGRSPAERCAQLEDPAVNGGRGSAPAGIAPPIPHAELAELSRIWAESGGPCPD